MSGGGGGDGGGGLLSPSPHVCHVLCGDSYELGAGDMQARSRLLEASG